MGVVIHQGKSIYMAGICIDISGQFLQKLFSVLIIIEDRRPIYTSYHNMMEGSGNIKSWLARHKKL